MESIKNRYDFVFFFDVKDGNPNGDPDAGNLPRIDAETGMGLVTDVCIKRKVRNYVQLTKFNQGGPEVRFDIYVKEKAVLGRAHIKAFKSLGIDLGEEIRKQIPEDLIDDISDYTLPDGLEIQQAEDDKMEFVVFAGTDLKEVKDALKGNPPENTKLEKFINDSIKGTKTRQPKPEEIEKGRVWMCNSFYDIRTFGAVLSLKSAPNCGQVRGPIQLTFARSVEPVIALEHSITRVAKTTEERAVKGGSEMGRKYTIPYGLYRTHGFISAHLSDQTGFSMDDLELFWKAMMGMFDHDHSAARGLMCRRKLVVFRHKDALGNKPAHELFERVTHRRTTEGPARDYKDYQILLDGETFPETFKIVDVQ
jgi:CRISPR-associated protein Csd2